MTETWKKRLGSMFQSLIIATIPVVIGFSLYAKKDYDATFDKKLEDLQEMKADKTYVDDKCLNIQQDLQRESNQTIERISRIEEKTDQILILVTQISNGK